MGAFYTAAAVMAVWMVLGAVGIIGFDPYPFAFLLFLSSLAQLIFMFVIIVGQDVLGRDADRCAVDTYQHTEVVLAQCRHMREHLYSQDATLARLVEELASRGAAGKSA